VHGDLATYLEGDGRDALQQLAATLDVKITVQAASGHSHREEFDLFVR
jgi:hypothetical protein